LPIDWIGKTKAALIDHCLKSGWRGAHLPKIGPVYLFKDIYAIHLDSVGIFLYQQICGRWVRLEGRGLAYANMRSLLCEPVIYFTDGSTFNLQQEVTT
jgi:hypothetical protein